MIMFITKVWFLLCFLLTTSEEIATDLNQSITGHTTTTSDSTNQGSGIIHYSNVSGYTVTASHRTNTAVLDGTSSNTTGSTLTGNETGHVTGNTTMSVPVNPFAIINQGFVSKKQYDTSSYVINIILKPIVCVSGVIMNIIGVCVLLRKNFRRSTYTYLCFLAMSDVGYLLCGIIRSIPKIVNLYDVVLANYIDMHIFPYITMYLDFAFTRLSVFLICAMSVERLVAVLRPLKVRELFLSRHAFPICIGLSVFCILLYVHNLFIYYPKPYFNPVHNVTMYAVGRHPWYAASTYKVIFTIFNDIINIYLPPIILIACNIGILTKVYQAGRLRAKLFASEGDNKISEDQRRMTLTLLVISFFFLSVFIPVIVVQFLSRYDQHIKAFGREHYFLFLMADVTSLFWSLSSANDFIVYICTSKQFRQTLVDMFCPGRKMMANQNLSTTNTLSSVAVSNSSVIG